MFKSQSRTFCMQILISIVEFWLLNSYYMEWNVFQNFSHIVKTELSRQHVDMIEFYRKLHIEDWESEMNHNKIFQH